MTFRDSPWPDGTPCWVDLVVPDRKRALAFYGALFGWDYEEGTEETGFYTLAKHDGRNLAGLMQVMPGQESMPAVWTTYLAVSDVDKTAEAIAEAGGTIASAPMDVMDLGRMAIAEDPGGAVFGIWQAGTHTGFQLANAPGAVTWNEGMSRDFAGAKAFYGKVFGYELDDLSAPGFDYATIAVGGNVVGGVGALSDEIPAEVPPHWATYFSVTDTDAAVAKVVELGGTVIMPAVDSPHGRVAAVADDQGAPFRVISAR
ncbi:VOC family protein [Amycolatopsis sp.]|jgi:predicted enzyme related to lactoylglutathione lyase|uniref:VOC family protein n=1 Tax=Amycolatopsis sp. TaxID=37632 RepID=UPI002DFFC6E7|nr:VOC family protein [Amycolatopsis sp.]